MKKNTFNDHFWSHGNGRDFINWSGKTILENKYNTSQFYEFDEKVDALVKNWLKKDQFNEIMKSLHGSKEINLPEDYLEFKKELEILPSWLDEDLIKTGCELSERSGLIGLLVLRDFALLGGYNFANLTKPLVATGSLEKSATQRLYNTLNFWVQVSRTNNNSYKTRINACISTRLIHSVSRIMIQEKVTNWDVEKYGIPINYSDIIATNFAFTIYYLYGLKKLKFNYSEKEEQSIFHLWKYITFLLGVPIEVIPNNSEEAMSFFKYWSEYQNKPDSDSRLLTASLLNENTPVKVLKIKIIKRNMSYIHKSIANYLIDNTVKKNLQIPAVRLKNCVPLILKLKNRFPVNREQQIVNGNKEQLSVLEDYKNNKS